MNFRHCCRCRWSLRYPLGVLLLTSPILYLQAQQLQVVSFGSAHAGFIKNQGQLRDQQGKPNHDVLFTWKERQFRLHLRSAGFSYEWFVVLPSSTAIAESGERNPYSPPDNAKTQVVVNRVDVDFVGATTQPTVVASDPTGINYHFYPEAMQNPDLSFVPSYREIIYYNLYPGIDLRFHFDEHHEVSPVRYSFAIRQGGSASRIQMRYTGAEHLMLHDSSIVYLTTPHGFLYETNLRAYSSADGRPLAVRRKQSGNLLTFELLQKVEGDYVIDPNLIWGSLYGGAEGEQVGEIASNSTGKKWIAGTTNSIAKIATTGAHQQVYLGNDDMFLAGFDENGKLTWATYFGGTENEMGYGVTVDNAGMVILVGKSHSSNQITTPDAYQPIGGGGGDNCIARFHSDGTLMWCTMFGKWAPENFRKAVCDDSNNIYVCGYTESDSLKVSEKNNSLYQGNGDALVVKFSPNGFPSWSAYVGGEGQDRAHAIDLDQFGNIFIVGTTSSVTGLATAGAFQIIHGGNTDDAFLARLDSTGNLLWATYYGGTGNDHGRDIVSNKKGHVYVVGFTNSPHVFGTSGSYQPRINSKIIAGSEYTMDGFVAKFSYNGSRAWGSYYGGNKDDQLLSVDWDGIRSIYVGGTTASGDSISLPSAFQKHRYGEPNDGYFGVFDSVKGALTYGSYIGGPGTDRIEDICTAPDKLLFMAGNTSGWFPTRPDVWQPTLMGMNDISVVRFSMHTACTDVFEPNETLLTAIPLTPTTDTTLYGYTGCIGNSNDQDWFRIKTKMSATNLKVRLTEFKKNFSLVLHNASGTPVTSSKPDPAGGISLVYNASKPRTYFLKIEHSPTDFDSVNCYRLRIWTSPTPFTYFTEELVSNMRTKDQDITIRLYPNPSRQWIMITASAERAGKAIISLNDLSGRCLWTEKLTIESGHRTYPINVANLAAGTYVLQWKQDDVLHYEKISIH